MIPSQFLNFLSDIWSDLKDPALLWQVIALITCLGLGWLVSRLLHRLFAQKEVQPRVVRFGVESFSRVLTPLLILGFLTISKSFFVKKYPTNLLRVAIALALSYVLIRLVFYVLRRIFARGGKVGNFLLLFEKAFVLLVGVGVVLYITGSWYDLIQYLEETTLLMGRHKVSVLVILQGGVSVIATLIVALWAGTALEERLMQLDTVHSSLRVVMARMGRALLIIVAVLMSLSLVGIDLTVLSVFGGALGVGLGLGLQKIVSSYVSGFVILLERSLTIGDMVAVEKYLGVVTQINTRYTVLRGLDGIEAVVPNEIFMSSPVQNYSLTDQALRLSTHVSVAYQSDIDEVIRLIEQVTANVERVAIDPAPQAMLIKFGADGFELEVGFWIIDPENGRTGVISDVNRAIWRVLKLHNIEIPYPQREVRFLNNSEIHNV